MRNLIKSFICLSLSFAAYVPDSSAKAPAAGKAKGEQCDKVQERLVSQCRSNGIAAGQTNATAGVGGQQDVHGAGAAALKSGQALGGVAKDCREASEECKKCSSAKGKEEEDKKEQEACAAAVLAAAGTIQQQSNATSSSGNDMMGAALMMGAAAIPALAALMKKDDEEDEEPVKSQAEKDGTVRADGSIDCSKPSAWQFGPCDSKTAETTCKNAMEDARCKVVANRYCNADGKQTDYCKTVAAYQYCTTGGGHDGCPTCENLKKISSNGCQNDPAGNNCLWQNTPERTEEMRNSCPGDPVFAGSQIAVNPTTGAPTTGGAPPANNGLPAPILPAGSNGQQAAIANPAGGSSQVAVMSVKQGRDAYNNNPTGTQVSGGGAGSKGFSAMSTGGARDVASGGPVPDVGAQFSPNLFSTGSQVIRNRCAAGRFNNCP